MTFFGVGKRRCVGEVLARAEAYLFFASLILAFKFKSTGSAPDFMSINGIVQYPKPFSVIIEPRR